MKLEGGNDVSLKAGQTFTFTTENLLSATAKWLR